MRKFLLTLFATLLMTANLWADASGTCGSNLNWTFNSSTGKLTITGSGSMNSWNNPSYIPWISVRLGITSVSLPAGLTSIGQNAFYLCSNLTSISVPNRVATIDYSAFTGCTGLTEVYVHRSTPPYPYRYIVAYATRANVTLHVPYGSS